MKRLLILCTAAGFAAATSSQLPAESRHLRPKLESLASRGNAEAFYHLGMIHHLGLHGTATDPRKAFEYFRRAADGGDPLGAYKLGCYYDGQGEGVVEDNPELALRYKLVAAEAGYALAQHDTALLYYKQQDTALALKWLKAAADQGDAGSLMAYASIHNGGEGIAKDPVTTLAYFSLALQAREESVTEAQTKWLSDFKAKMSEVDKARAEKIISTWKSGPTPLTIKALSGDRAAETLVAGTR